MSTDLPAEEDVLAHLVLYAARPVTTNVDATAQMMERIAWNAAIADLDLPGNAASVVARSRLVVRGSLEAAIADTERRYEVERARSAVLNAVALAYATVEYPQGESIETAYERLMRAEMEVSRHGG